MWYRPFLLEFAEMATLLELLEQNVLADALDFQLYRPFVVSNMARLLAPFESILVLYFPTARHQLKSEGVDRVPIG